MTNISREIEDARIFAESYPKLMSFVMRWNVIFKESRLFKESEFPVGAFCDAATELLKEIEDNWK